METVQLKVRKAKRNEVLDDLNQIIPGTIYILRSLLDHQFCRTRSTLQDAFKENEFHGQLREQIVYIQQLVQDVDLELDSTSISIPVQIATVNDIAFNKTAFKIGTVYFIKNESGRISRRMMRIAGDTHLGDLVKLLKEKRIYVQQSVFKNKISVVPAFAKAELPQAS